MSVTQCQFIWYELITSDAPAAETFYKAVVGWDARDSGMPGGMKYSLFSTSGFDVAGLMQVTPEMCGWTKPVWTGVIAVDDVEAYAKKIEEMGGKVRRAPDDIPGVGRFAVVADPHGASFEILQPSGPPPEKIPSLTAPGMVGWNELHAGDGEEAWDFYSKTFGWLKDRPVDMGEVGNYQLFNYGELAVGAMMTKFAEIPAPMWLFYFNVEEINSAIERVKINGGHLLAGPMDVPGPMYVAQFLDPQGAMFALVSSSKQ